MADQLTKWLAVQQLSDGARFPLAPGLLWFELVHNRGVAFGMMQGARWPIIVWTVILIGALSVWVWRSRSPSGFDLTCAAMVSGGALGNLIDRVRLGYVIDFIAVPRWPVFNIADSCISVAAVLWAVHALRITSHKDQAGHVRR